MATLPFLRLLLGDQLLGVLCIGVLLHGGARLHLVDVVKAGL